MLSFFGPPANFAGKLVEARKLVVAGKLVEAGKPIFFIGQWLDDCRMT